MARFPATSDRTHRGWRCAPWSFSTWLLVLLLCTGCHWFSPPPDMAAPPPTLGANPATVQTVDRDVLWNQLVDVVDDYFKVRREDRVKLLGDVLTEGRLETYPRGGSTVLEPWNKDSTTAYERWESTLQSIRRTAVVRVVPADNRTFLVDVAVFKELEDVPRPELGLASRADLRNDNSLERTVTPVGGQQPNIGWIPLGRDLALEQEIIAQLQARMAGVGVPQPLY